MEPVLHHNVLLYLKICLNAVASPSIDNNIYLTRSEHFLHHVHSWIWCKERIMADQGAERSRIGSDIAAGPWEMLCPSSKSRRLGFCVVRNTVSQRMRPSGVVADIQILTVSFCAGPQQPKQLMQ